MMPGIVTWFLLIMPYICFGGFLIPRYESHQCSVNDIFSEWCCWKRGWEFKLLFQMGAITCCLITG